MGHQKHFLTNISESDRTADCSLCGKVTIYWARTAKTPYWYCGKTLVKTKCEYKHELSDVCEISKTAYCKNCGLVGIRKDGQTRKWKCLLLRKGKVSKDKKLHRSVKKGYCEECGFIAEHPTQIDIHHIDGSHKNNEISNLKSLCGRCHIREHYKTYEELDEIRIAGLLERRWLCLLNKDFIPKDEYLENIGKNHKPLGTAKHILRYICPYSKTAYCDICGLVQLKIRKNESCGAEYWDCNRGGTRSYYGKKDHHKNEKIKAFFRSVKKPYCEECGFVAVIGQQIQIHHIDGNHNNNILTNLKSTCPCCHRLYHLDYIEQAEKRRLKRLTESREAAKAIKELASN